MAKILLNMSGVYKITEDPSVFREISRKVQKEIENKCSLKKNIVHEH